MLPIKRLHQQLIALTVLLSMSLQQVYPIFEVWMANLARPAVVKAQETQVGWGAWVAYSVSESSNGKLSQARSFAQAVEPQTKKPKQHLLSVDGAQLWTRTFENGQWGEWTMAPVASLNLPGNSNQLLKLPADGGGLQAYPTDSTSVLQRVSDYSQTDGDTATGNRARQTFITSDGKAIQQRFRTNNTWESWLSAPSSLAIEGMNAFRSFSQSLQPVTQYPKQDFLSDNGQVIKFRLYQNNTWGAWQTTTINQMGLPGGQSGIADFDQTSGDSATGGKPKQTVVSADGRTLYSRTFEGIAPTPIPAPSASPVTVAGPGTILGRVYVDSNGNGQAADEPTRNQGVQSSNLSCGDYVTLDKVRIGWTGSAAGSVSVNSACGPEPYYGASVQNGVYTVQLGGLPAGWEVTVATGANDKCKPHPSIAKALECRVDAGQGSQAWFGIRERAAECGHWSAVCNNGYRQEMTSCAEQQTWNATFANQGMDKWKDEVCKLENRGGVSGGSTYVAGTGGGTGGSAITSEPGMPEQACGVDKSCVKGFKCSDANICVSKFDGKNAGCKGQNQCHPGLYCDFSFYPGTSWGLCRPEPTSSGGSGGMSGGSSGVSGGGGSCFGAWDCSGGAYCAGAGSYPDNPGKCVQGENRDRSGDEIAQDYIAAGGDAKQVVTRVQNFSGAQGAVSQQTVTQISQQYGIVANQATETVPVGGAKTTEGMLAQAGASGLSISFEKPVGSTGIYCNYCGGFYADPKGPGCQEQGKRACGVKDTTGTWAFDDSGDVGATCRNADGSLCVDGYYYGTSSVVVDADGNVVKKDGKDWVIKSADDEKAASEQGYSTIAAVATDGTGKSGSYVAVEVKKEEVNGVTNYFASVAESATLANENVQKNVAYFTDTSRVNASATLATQVANKKINDVVIQALDSDTPDAFNTVASSIHLTTEEKEIARKYYDEAILVDQAEALVFGTSSRGTNATDLIENCSEGASTCSIQTLLSDIENQLKKSQNSPDVVAQFKAIKAFNEIAACNSESCKQSVTRSLSADTREKFSFYQAASTEITGCLAKESDEEKAACLRAAQNSQDGITKQEFDSIKAILINNIQQQAVLDSTQVKQTANQMVSCINLPEIQADQCQMRALRGLETSEEKMAANQLFEVELVRINSVLNSCLSTLNNSQVHREVCLRSQDSLPSAARSYVQTNVQRAENLNASRQNTYTNTIKSCTESGKDAPACQTALAIAQAVFADTPDNFTQLNNTIKLVDQQQSIFNDAVKAYEAHLQNPDDPKALFTYNLFKDAASRLGIAAELSAQTEEIAEAYQFQVSDEAIALKKALEDQYLREDAFFRTDQRAEKQANYVYNRFFSEASTKAVTAWECNEPSPDPNIPMNECWEKVVGFEYLNAAEAQKAANQRAYYDYTVYEFSQLVREMPLQNQYEDFDLTPEQEQSLRQNYKQMGYSDARIEEELAKAQSSSRTFNPLPNRVFDPNDPTIQDQLAAYGLTQAQIDEVLGKVVAIKAKAFTGGYFSYQQSGMPSNPIAVQNWLDGMSIAENGFVEREVDPFDPQFGESLYSDAYKEYMKTQYLSRPNIQAYWGWGNEKFGSEVAQVDPSAVADGVLVTGNRNNANAIDKVGAWVGGMISRVTSNPLNSNHEEYQAAYDEGLAAARADGEDWFGQQARALEYVNGLDSYYSLKNQEETGFVTGMLSPEITCWNTNSNYCREIAFQRAQAACSSAEGSAEEVALCYQRQGQGYQAALETTNRERGLRLGAMVGGLAVGVVTAPASLLTATLAAGAFDVSAYIGTDLVTSRINEEVHALYAADSATLNSNYAQQISSQAYKAVLKENVVEFVTTAAFSMGGEIAGRGLGVALGRNAVYKQAELVDAFVKSANEGAQIVSDVPGRVTNAISSVPVVRVADGPPITSVDDIAQRLFSKPVGELNPEQLGILDVWRKYNLSANPNNTALSFLEPGSFGRIGNKNVTRVEFEQLVQAGKVKVNVVDDVVTNISFTDRAIGPLNVKTYSVIADSQSQEAAEKFAKNVLEGVGNTARDDLWGVGGGLNRRIGQKSVGDITFDDALSQVKAAIKSGNTSELVNVTVDLASVPPPPPVEPQTSTLVRVWDRIIGRDAKAPNVGSLADDAADVNPPAAQVIGPDGQIADVASPVRPGDTPGIGGVRVEPDSPANPGSSVVAPNNSRAPPATLLVNENNVVIGLDGNGRLIGQFSDNATDLEIAQAVRQARTQPNVRIVDRTIFRTQIGDAPEQIRVIRVAANGDITVQQANRLQQALNSNRLTRPFSGLREIETPTTPANSAQSIAEEAQASRVAEKNSFKDTTLPEIHAQREAGVLNLDPADPNSHLRSVEVTRADGLKVNRLQIIAPDNASNELASSIDEFNLRMNELLDYKRYESFSPEQILDSLDLLDLADKRIRAVNIRSAGFGKTDVDDFITYWNVVGRKKVMIRHQPSLSAVNDVIGDRLRITVEGIPNPFKDVPIITIDQGKLIVRSAAGVDGTKGTEVITTLAQLNKLTDDGAIIVTQVDQSAWFAAQGKKVGRYGVSDADDLAFWHYENLVKYGDQNTIDELHLLAGRNYTVRGAPKQFADLTEKELREFFLDIDAARLDSLIAESRVAPSLQRIKDLSFEAARNNKSPRDLFNGQGRVLDDSLYRQTHLDLLDQQIGSANTSQGAKAYLSELREQLSGASTTDEFDSLLQRGMKNVETNSPQVARALDELRVRQQVADNVWQTWQKVAGNDIDFLDGKIQFHSRQVPTGETPSSVIDQVVQEIEGRELLTRAGKPNVPDASAVKVADFEFSLEQTDITLEELFQGSGQTATPQRVLAATGARTTGGAIEPIVAGAETYFGDGSMNGLRQAIAQADLDGKTPFVVLVDDGISLSTQEDEVIQSLILKGKRPKRVEVATGAEYRSYRITYDENGKYTKELIGNPTTDKRTWERGFIYLDEKGNFLKGTDGQSLGFGLHDEWDDGLLDFAPLNPEDVVVISHRVEQFDPTINPYAQPIIASSESSMSDAVTQGGNRYRGFAAQRRPNREAYLRSKGFTDEQIQSILQVKPIYAVRTIDDGVYDAAGKFHPATVFDGLDSVEIQARLLELQPTQPTTVRRTLNGQRYEFVYTPQAGDVAARVDEVTLNNGNIAARVFDANLETDLQRIRVDGAIKRLDLSERAIIDDVYKDLQLNGNLSRQARSELDIVHREALLERARTTQLQARSYSQSVSTGQDVFYTRVADYNSRLKQFVESIKRVEGVDADALASRLGLDKPLMSREDFLRAFEAPRRVPDTLVKPVTATDHLSTFINQFQKTEIAQAYGGPRQAMHVVAPFTVDHGLVNNALADRVATSLTNVGARAQSLPVIGRSVQKAVDFISASALTDFKTKALFESAARSAISRGSLDAFLGYQGLNQQGVHQRGGVEYVKSFIPGTQAYAQRQLYNLIEQQLADETINQELFDAIPDQVFVRNQSLLEIIIRSLQGGDDAEPSALASALAARLQRSSATSTATTSPVGVVAPAPREATEARKIPDWQSVFGNTDRTQVHDALTGAGIGGALANSIYRAYMGAQDGNFNEDALATDLRAAPEIDEAEANQIIASLKEITEKSRETLANEALLLQADVQVIFGSFFPGRDIQGFVKEIADSLVDGDNGTQPDTRRILETTIEKVIDEIPDAQISTIDAISKKLFPLVQQQINESSPAIGGADPNGPVDEPATGDVDAPANEVVDPGEGDAIADSTDSNPVTDGTAPDTTTTTVDTTVPDSAAAAVVAPATTTTTSSRASALFNRLSAWVKKGLSSESSDATTTTTPDTSTPAAGGAAAVDSASTVDVNKPSNRTRLGQVTRKYAPSVGKAILALFFPTATDISLRSYLIIRGIELLVPRYTIVPTVFQIGRLALLDVPIYFIMAARRGSVINLKWYEQVGQDLNNVFEGIRNIFRRNAGDDAGETTTTATTTETTSTVSAVAPEPEVIAGSASLPASVPASFEPVARIRAPKVTIPSAGTSGATTILDSRNPGELVQPAAANLTSAATSVVPQISMGRGSFNTVQIEQDSDLSLFNAVSRQHGIIYHNGSTFVLADADSTNGIYVNGERLRVQQIALADETIFHLGQVPFRFKIIGDYGVVYNARGIEVARTLKQTQPAITAANTKEVIRIGKELGVNNIANRNLAVKHARIEHNGRGFVIFPESGRNDVYVDRSRVDTRRGMYIGYGQIIKVGRAWFYFTIENGLGVLQAIGSDAVVAVKPLASQQVVDKTTAQSRNDSKVLAKSSQDKLNTQAKTITQATQAYAEQLVRELHTYSANHIADLNQKLQAGTIDRSQVKPAFETVLQRRFQDYLVVGANNQTWLWAALRREIMSKTKGLSNEQLNQAATSAQLSILNALPDLLNEISGKLAINEVSLGQRTVLALGDVHGDWKRFEEILQGKPVNDPKGGLLPSAQAPMRSNGTPNRSSTFEVYQLGDLVDRAPDGQSSLQTVQKFRAFQAAAGVNAQGKAKVKAFLGNHEAILLAKLQEMDNYFASNRISNPTAEQLNAAAAHAYTTVKNIWRNLVNRLSFVSRTQPQSFQGSSVDGWLSVPGRLGNAPEVPIGQVAVISVPGGITPETIFKGQRITEDSVDGIRHLHTLINNYNTGKITDIQYFPIFNRADSAENNRFFAVSYTSSLGKGEDGRPRERIYYVFALDDRNRLVGYAHEVVFALNDNQLQVDGEYFRSNGVLRGLDYVVDSLLRYELASSDKKYVSLFRKSVNVAETPEERSRWEAVLSRYKNGYTYTREANSSQFTRFIENVDSEVQVKGYGNVESGILRKDAEIGNNGVQESVNDLEAPQASWWQRLLNRLAVPLIVSVMSLFGFTIDSAWNSSDFFLPLGRITLQSLGVGGLVFLGQIILPRVFNFAQSFIGSLISRAPPTITLSFNRLAGLFGQEENVASENQPQTSFIGDTVQPTPIIPESTVAQPVELDSTFTIKRKDDGSIESLLLDFKPPYLTIAYNGNVVKQGATIDNIEAGDILHIRSTYSTPTIETYRAELHQGKLSFYKYSPQQSKEVTFTKISPYFSDTSREDEAVAGSMKFESAKGTLRDQIAELLKPYFPEGSTRVRSVISRKQTLRSRANSYVDSMVRLRASKDRGMEATLVNFSASADQDSQVLVMYSKSTGNVTIRMKEASVTPLTQSQAAEIITWLNRNYRGGYTLTKTTTADPSMKNIDWDDLGLRTTATGHWSKTLQTGEILANQQVMLQQIQSDLANPDSQINQALRNADRDFVFNHRQEILDQTRLSGELQDHWIDELASALIRTYSTTRESKVLFDNRSLARELARPLVAQRIKLTNEWAKEASAKAREATNKSFKSFNFFEPSKVELALPNKLLSGPIFQDSELAKIWGSARVIDLYNRRLSLLGMSLSDEAVGSLARLVMFPVIQEAIIAWAKDVHAPTLESINNVLAVAKQDPQYPGDLRDAAIYLPHLAELYKGKAFVSSKIHDGGDIIDTPLSNVQRQIKPRIGLGVRNFVVRSAVIVSLAIMAFVGIFHTPANGVAFFNDAYTTSIEIFSDAKEYFSENSDQENSDNFRQIAIVVEEDTSVANAITGEDSLDATDESSEIGSETNDGQEPLTQPEDNLNEDTSDKDELTLAKDAETSDVAPTTTELADDQDGEIDPEIAAADSDLEEPEVEVVVVEKTGMDILSEKIGRDVANEIAAHLMGGNDYSDLNQDALAVQVERDYQKILEQVGNEPENVTLEVVRALNLGAQTVRVSDDLIVITTSSQMDLPEWIPSYGEGRPESPEITIDGVSFVVPSQTDYMCGVHTKTGAVQYVLNQMDNDRIKVLIDPYVFAGLLSIEYMDERSAFDGRVVADYLETHREDLVKRFGYPYGETVAKYASLNAYMQTTGQGMFRKSFVNLGVDMRNIELEASTQKELASKFLDLENTFDKYNIPHAITVALISSSSHSLIYLGQETQNGINYIRLVDGRATNSDSNPLIWGYYPGIIRHADGVTYLMPEDVFFEKYLDTQLFFSVDSNEAVAQILKGETPIVEVDTEQAAQVDALSIDNSEDLVKAGDGKSLNTVSVNVEQSESRVYFSRLTGGEATEELYKQLPDLYYDQQITRPREIIFHWSGTANTTAQGIFNGMAQSEADSHFGVGDDSIQQYLPMGDDWVHVSTGAYLYQQGVINIEAAGVGFDIDESGNPINIDQKVLNNSVELIADLMIYYGISIDNVLGHNERDREVYIDTDGSKKINDRGKPDPGNDFISFLRIAVLDEIRRRGVDIEPYDFGSQLVFRPDGLPDSAAVLTASTVPVGSMVALASQTDLNESNLIRTNFAGQFRGSEFYFNNQPAQIITSQNIKEFAAQGESFDQAHIQSIQQALLQAYTPGNLNYDQVIQSAMRMGYSQNEAKQIVSEIKIFISEDLDAYLTEVRNKSHGTTPITFVEENGRLVAKLNSVAFLRKVVSGQQYVNYISSNGEFVGYFSARDIGMEEAVQVFSWLPILELYNEGQLGDVDTPEELIAYLANDNGRALGELIQHAALELATDGNWSGNAYAILVAGFEVNASTNALVSLNQFAQAIDARLGTEYYDQRTNSEELLQTLSNAQSLSMLRADYEGETGERLEDLLGLSRSDDDIVEIKAQSIANIEKPDPVTPIGSVAAVGGTSILSTISAWMSALWKRLRGKSAATSVQPAQNTSLPQEPNVVATFTTGNESIDIRQGDMVIVTTTAQERRKVAVLEVDEFEQLAAIRLPADGRVFVLHPDNPLLRKRDSYAKAQRLSSADFDELRARETGANATIVFSKNALGFEAAKNTDSTGPQEAQTESVDQVQSEDIPKPTPEVAGTDNVALKTNQSESLRPASASRFTRAIRSLATAGSLELGFISIATVLARMYFAGSDITHLHPTIQFILTDSRGLGLSFVAASLANILAYFIISTGPQEAQTESVDQVQSEDAKPQPTPLIESENTIRTLNKQQGIVVNTFENTTFSLLDYYRLEAAENRIQMKNIPLWILPAVKLAQELESRISISKMTDKTDFMSTRELVEAYSEINGGIADKLHLQRVLNIFSDELLKKSKIKGIRESFGVIADILRLDLDISILELTGSIVSRLSPGYLLDPDDACSMSNFSFVGKVNARTPLAKPRISRAYPQDDLKPSCSLIKRISIRVVKLSVTMAIPSIVAIYRMGGVIVFKTTILTAIRAKMTQIWNLQYELTRPYSARKFEETVSSNLPTPTVPIEHVLFEPGTDNQEAQLLLDTFSKRQILLETVKPWSIKQLQLINDVCSNLATSMCLGVTFNNGDTFDACAKSEALSRTIYMRCMNYSIIVHELLHLAEFSEGVILPTDKLPGFYWSYKGQDHVVPMININKRLIIDFIDLTWEQDPSTQLWNPIRDGVKMNWGYVRSQEEFEVAIRNIPKEMPLIEDREFYGIQAGPSEHFATLGQFYYEDSAKLLILDKKLYDFYRERVFDGRVFYDGVCGYYETSRVPTVETQEDDEEVRSYMLQHVFVPGGEVCKN